MNFILIDKEWIKELGKHVLVVYLNSPAISKYLCYLYFKS